MKCRWCHNPESQSPRPEMLFFIERCIGCGLCRAVCPHDAAFPINPVNQSLKVSFSPKTGTSSACLSCGQCIRACPTDARQLAGRRLTVADVIHQIEQDTIFYEESGGGVTFSGGEPLYQPEFLVSLLQACHERELHTAVETAGLAPVEIITRVNQYTGLWLYDLKLVDDARHRAFTGVSNHLILENLQLLASSHNPVIVRIPVIRGINDDDRNIDDTGRLLAELKIKEVHILGYHHTGVEKYARLNRPYDLSKTAEPDETCLDRVVQQLSGYGLYVKTGG